MNLNVVCLFGVFLPDVCPKPHTIYKSFPNTLLVIFRDIGPLLRENYLDQELISREYPFDTFHIRRFQVLCHAASLEIRYSMPCFP